MADIASVSTKEKGQVLIVDDVEVNRFVLSNIIRTMGYQPVTAENGIKALEVIKEALPALILLDVAMPEMDGYELITILKADPSTRDIPVIFISAYDETEDMVKGFKLGGQDYLVKPFLPEVVKARVGVHLRFYEAQKELQETNRRLQASLSNQLRQIEEEKKGILYALANMARKNTLYDEDYFERLQYNCKIIAQALQIADAYPDIVTDAFIDNIEMAAPLLDVGNVAIPEEVLQKTSGLDENESKLMKTHTVVGARILTDIIVKNDYMEFVKMAIDIAKYHHENWDGTGYPYGLKGDEIPLAAQIVSAASVFCALTAKRSFRDAFSREEASEIMSGERGVMFNPVIFDICKMIGSQIR